MTSALPFDDIRDLVARLPGANERAVSPKTPPQSRMGALALWLARWSGADRTPARRPLLALFAGTHGVAGKAGAAKDAVETTVAAIGAGMADVNSLCASFDLGLKLFDLALAVPTVDFTVEAALDERGCAGTIAFGMEAVAGGADLVAIAGLGDAADTAAAVLVAALRGIAPERLAPEEAREAVAALAGAAAARHGRNLSQPLEALRRIGGREFAAILGAVLAARMERAPVVLDGKAALAVAAVLHALRPDALEHCLLAALPREAGWQELADRLELDCVLGRFEGEPGEAAAIACGIVKAAAPLLQRQT